MPARTARSRTRPKAKRLSRRKLRAVIEKLLVERADELAAIKPRKLRNSDTASGRGEITFWFAARKKPSRVTHSRRRSR